MRTPFHDSLWGFLRWVAGDSSLVTFLEWLSVFLFFVLCFVVMLLISTSLPDSGEIARELQR